jgi:CRP-like cAMP-binding protein
MGTMKFWESYYEALKRQDWKGTLKILKSLKKIEPKNPQVYLKIGDLFRRTGNIIDATKAYHESAELLIKQGFVQKAIAIYKIILNIDPSNDDAIERSKEILEGTAKASKEKSESVAPAPAFQSLACDEELTKKDDAELIEKEEVESSPFPKGLPALLSFLTEKEVVDIIGRAEIRLYNDDQKIIEEGDSGDSIFIIKSGQARVIAHIMGKEIELATLSEGDVFGEVGFLTGRLRTASVISKGDLEVIELGRVLLEEIIEKSPEVLKKIEDIYGCRVEDTVSKLKTLKEI